MLWVEMQCGAIRRGRQKMRRNKCLSPTVVRIGLALTVVSALTGCMDDRPARPAFYDSMARVDAKVDQQVAAQMISQYRANNNLGPVTVDPVLTAIASSQAKAMAAAGSVNASLPKAQQLSTRMASIGEPDTHAVENVSGGYRTFAEAFSGWRESSKHNAVMLDEKATRLGLATAYAPNAKHKVFWSLVMAGPKD